MEATDRKLLAMMNKTVEMSLEMLSMGDRKHLEFLSEITGREKAIRKLSE